MRCILRTGSSAAWLAIRAPSLLAGRTQMISSKRWVPSSSDGGLSWFLWKEMHQAGENIRSERTERGGDDNYKIMNWMAIVNFQGLL